MENQIEKIMENQMQTGALNPKVLRFLYQNSSPGLVV